MTLRFGTDGVRGVANRELTPELVTALGRATARVLGPNATVRDRPRHAPVRPDARGRAGRRDLRRGRRCRPRGRAAHSRRGRMSRANAAPPAAVISASHNPFPDNGVKLFAAGGRKIPEPLEPRSSSELRGAGGRPTGARARVGVGVSAEHRGTLDDYVATWSTRSQGRQLAGLHVVVDCGNGAAFRAAPSGAARARRRRRRAPRRARRRPTSTTAAARPIPTISRRRCRSVGADVGLAFDGDADRVIAVDEQRRAGRRRPDPGDLAIDLHDRGLLRGDAVVATVMSNLGLRRALEPLRHRPCVETPVGDRNVLDALERRDLVARRRAVGSRDLRATTRPPATARSPASSSSTRWPGAGVRSPSSTSVLDAGAADAAQRGGRRRRLPRRSDAAFWSRVRDVDDELGDDGRVLVRPSGTEPLVRVMVESTDADAAADAADRLVELVEHAASRSAPARL